MALPETWLLLAEDHGAAGENRTHDPTLTKGVLYL